MLILIVLHWPAMVFTSSFHHMWNVLRLRPIPAIRQCRWKSNTPDTDSFATFKARILNAEKESAKNKPEWEKREESLRKRYGEWNPTRKLSRQQIADIRSLKEQWPLMKTKQLADHFHVNPESIRRILKSKWIPNEDEIKDLNERAEKRKLASQERKKAQAEALTTIRPTKGSLKYGREAKRAARRRKHSDNKLPFTVGVGDLID